MNATIGLMQEVSEAWTRTMGRGEIELNVIRVFCLVAEAGGRPIPQASIRERTGLAESSVSRNVAMLSIGATASNPGPKLLESYEDPEYRRRKLVKLTAAGKRFVEALETIHRKYTL